MARRVIYLKQELESVINQFASEQSLDFNQAIRLIINEAATNLENKNGKGDLDHIKSQLDKLLILVENLLPEIHFLSATTRSSLLGKSENPLLDGDLAAQKSRRFLASLLKDITPSFEERLDQ